MRVVWAVLVPAWLLLVVGPLLLDDSLASFGTADSASAHAIHGKLVSHAKHQSENSFFGHFPRVSIRRTVRSLSSTAGAYPDFLLGGGSADAIDYAVRGISAEVPPHLARTWQFASRTASQPRAPA